MLKYKHKTKELENPTAEKIDNVINACLAEWRKEKNVIRVDLTNISCVSHNNVVFITIVAVVESTINTSFKATTSWNVTV